MSTQYTIVPAEPQASVAAAVLRVEQASLHDSPYTAEEVLAVMHRPEQRVFTAVERATGEVVGFCATFTTPTPAGPRLEVDMLGVPPEHRGRGLGGRLVRAAAEWAEAQGLYSARGIVAVDNAPSQGAFRRAGFAPAETCDLWVYGIEGAAPVPLPVAGWRYEAEAADASGAAITVRILDEGGRRVATAACLRVHTLSYTGLWVEETRAPSPVARMALARAAVEHAKTLDLREVGRLLPVTAASDSPAEAEEWLRAGYQRVGRYTVWTRETPAAGGR